MKIERKYLAHFLDAGKLNGGTTSAFVRLGEDLEEYNEELNPDVEVKKNILGEQSVQHNGYEVQSEVDTYYADSGSALSTALMSIANERKKGDDCKTTKVDVLFSVTVTEGTPSVAVTWAYQEDVKVIPTSVGGDTSGVQIPFTVYAIGNRKAVTVTLSGDGYSAITIED